MTARDSGEKRGQTGKVWWMIPGKTLTDDHDHGGLLLRDAGVERRRWRRVRRGKNRRGRRERIGGWGGVEGKGAEGKCGGERGKWKRRGMMGRKWERK